MMDASKPLSDRVRECMNAHFVPIEGAKYIGIYDDGYRLIANLILIASDKDTDFDTKDKAKQYLSEIDERGSIGERYKDIYRFTLVHKTSHKTQRREQQVGYRRLRPGEVTRLRTLLERKDIKDQDMSELKRINASVNNFKITSVDFNKLRDIAIAYAQIKPGGARIGHVNGWRAVDDKIFEGLNDIIDRTDTSISVKREASQLLEDVKDRRLKTERYIDAQQLITSNRLTKKETAKLVTAVKQFEHAVVVACQACDNMDDITIPAMAKALRLRLVAQLSNSAGNLLKLQYALLLQEESHEG
jgi:hypothetical protein